MIKCEQDSRTRRTKAALRAGLAALIREKGVAGVTVRELAERAGINRATFYIHYHDIDDMLGHIYREILSDLAAVLEMHQKEESAERPFSILCDIFRFLQKHSAMCAALLSERGDPAFIEQIKAPLRDKCVRDWKRLRPDEPNEHRAAYFASYIVSGCVGLFEHWLKGGMQETPEEMAQLADRMIRTGVKTMLTP